MLRSDFGSALMSGAQKSGALELVGLYPKGRSCKMCESVRQKLGLTIILPSLVLNLWPLVKVDFFVYFLRSLCDAARRLFPTKLINVRSSNHPKEKGENFPTGLSFMEKQFE